jgi:hypothetical protein
MVDNNQLVQALMGPGTVGTSGKLPIDPETDQILRRAIVPLMTQMAPIGQHSHWDQFMHNARPSQNIDAGPTPSNAGALGTMKYYMNGADRFNPNEPMTQKLYSPMPPQPELPPSGPWGEPLK